MSMAVVGIRASSRRVLERRLAMIMKGRASLHLTRVGLASLAVMAALTLPGWAAAPQDPPPPPPPVPVVRPAVAPAVPAPVAARAPRLQPPVAVPVVAQTPKPAPAVNVQAPRVQTPGVPTVARAPSPARAVAPQTPRARPAQIPVPSKNLTVYVTETSAKLPEDGQEIVKGFDAEREAIQAEAERRIEERRQAVIKALQDLQERYAREGKLDEAVAVRNYLRAGGPGLNVTYAIKSRGIR
jgi:hypothetical protein